MPTFIDPDHRRMQKQTNANHFQYAGQTATWRAWLTATTGNPAIGIGQTNLYRQQTITALFSMTPAFPGVVAANTMNQYPGGQYPEGMLFMNTRQPVGNRDEIIYNGIRYKVDTVGQPSVMNSFYMSILRRAETGT